MHVEHALSFVKQIYDQLLHLLNPKILNEQSQ